MTHKNKLALTLILISFGVLYPGLTQPLVTLTASLAFLGTVHELFNDTRSILGTIDGLRESGNLLVAGLIFLFSVVVPFIKGVMILLAFSLKTPKTKWKLFAFVRAISKWAMCDVFVVGVYVAFLSAKATDNLDAQIGVGFYYFTSYCLLSLVAMQIMDIPNPDAAQSPAARG